MNAWKVILATLVIYMAGLGSGILVTKSLQPRQARPPADTAQIVPLLFAPERLLERMKHELRLSPQQLKKIDAIFGQSREHMKDFLTLLEPEVQSQVSEVRDHIRAELTPDQRVKFEKLLKERRRLDLPHPSEGRRRPRDNAAHETNARPEKSETPASPPAPPPSNSAQP